MNKKLLKKIEKILDQCFPHPAPPLIFNNTFSLLVATILSARCTDLQVNKVTPLLFEKYPDINDLAKAKQSDVQKIIRPCGLSPFKSTALVETAKILLQTHNGIVPATFDELEKLPGVGHKTASVVISQGFGIPAFPVDTHIHRLAKRWGLSNGTSVLQTEKDLKTAFKKEDWNKRHLQMIFFGRKYCPARGHVIKNCPICCFFPQEYTSR
jgi:endonuclease III